MYFSVIVTAYRVEPYLRACVESILAQTWEDFELILVDDGSPDCCPAICDEYAGQDPRVKVIHQKNSGVVKARKAGLLAAAGQYIVFVDGDDRIAEEFLARGKTLLEESRADLLCFASSCEEKNHQKLLCEPVPEGLYGKKAVQRRIYPCLLMDANMNHMSYFVHGKIFRRSLANACFLAVNPQISLGEDMLCVVPAYLTAQRVYISREAMSFYRVREQSGSHGFQIGHYRQVSLALAALKELKQNAPGGPDDFGRQIRRYGAFMCFTLMIHAVNDKRFADLGEIRRQMKRPALKGCLRQARFRNISPKTRIAFFLLKRDRFLLCYLFLRVCKGMKTLSCPENTGRKERVKNGETACRGNTVNQRHYTCL